MQPSTSPRPKPLRPLLRRLGLVLLSLWLLLSLWQAPVIKAETHRDELRGLWITNLGGALMYSSTRLDETVAEAKQLGFNTLYPAVWNRGYSSYPSPIAKQAGALGRDPLTSIPLLPCQDSLAGYVRQAKRQNLRLIPWFEYGLWIPTSSRLAKAHPDWLTQMRNGQQVANPYPPSKVIPHWLDDIRLEVMGGNQAWLNPFHPEVQQFLTDLIVDVVTRYDVDGIQLDDHFGLAVDFGYDPFTEELYAADHGGMLPPLDSSDPQWMAWRAERLTGFMTQIHDAVKAANPKAIISLSPNTPDFAYRNYLQDWSRWVDLGLIDEAIAQVYRPDLTSFEDLLYSPELLRLQGQLPLSVGIYTGPGRNGKPIADTLAQAQASLAAGYDGFAFFCWETTLWMLKRDSAALVNQAFQTLF
jgi:uncharacterized lipoprotein YddW (UPF0748 family)